MPDQFCNTPNLFTKGELSCATEEQTAVRIALQGMAQLLINAELTDTRIPITQATVLQAIK